LVVTIGVMAKGGRENELYGRFLGPAPLDAALAALAIEHHAVFELRQLCELGLSPRAVQKRAAAGRLHRIYHGVYALVPPELLTREERWLAAVYACGPGAVLSHRSAAALHELRASERARIDVTVPGRSGRTHPGIDIHRSRTLSPADTTRVSNIPCTTVARTQLDIAEVVNRRGVERLFDQAEIVEVFDLRKLQNQLDRNHGRRGARVVRSVLAEHYAGRTPTWSELEEAFLALTRAAGLPDPEVNVFIVIPDGGPAIRVDFLWRAQRLVVETDGHKTHRTRQAFERDRRNDQRLTAAGYTPIRTTWQQITREAEELSARLVTLMRL
jgi:predicted transcriptional regulator of viral defense system